MDYFQGLATQLGISLWLLIVVFIWSSVWKFLALWKSARKNHVCWFIVFALISDLGILEILYIYLFSESCCKNKAKNETKKPVKKRK